MPDSIPQLDLGSRPCCHCQGQSVYQLRSVYAWEVLRQVAQSPALCLSRKEVCAFVWPEVEEVTALQRLRQTLLYLKKGLPHSEDWLKITKEYLRIDPSKVTISGLDCGFMPVDIERKETSWVHPFFSFTSGLDWESRRSAVLGIASAAFAVGQLEEALSELTELRRLRPENIDLDLLLTEADFCQTLYRLDDAASLLDMVPAELSPRREAKRNLVSAHLHLRTDNASAALPYCLNALNSYVSFKSVNSSLRAGLCVFCCYSILETQSRIPALISSLHRILSSSPASEWQGVLTWLRACTRYPVDGVLAETAAKQMMKSKLSAVTAVHLARAGHELFSQGNEKFGTACCFQAVNQLSGTDLQYHEAEAQTYLAEQHRLRGRHKEALVAFSASLRLRRGGECQIGLGTSLRGAGMSLLSLKDYEGAFDRLTEAYRAFESVNDELSMATVAVSLECCRNHIKGQKLDGELLRRSVKIIQDAVRSPFLRSCLPEDLREAGRFAVKA